MSLSAAILLALGSLHLAGHARGYFVLGKLYWFRIPFAGISIALACYIGSIAASWD